MYKVYNLKALVMSVPQHLGHDQENRALLSYP